MFARLLSHPGVRQELSVRSTFGFLAFHGGSLERGTDDIARAAAAASDSSYYGVVMPPEFRWHLPSKRVDPAVSDQLRHFLDHVDTVIAVHGYGRAGMFTTVLLGGSHRPLAAHVGALLRDRLGHYEVRDELDTIPGDLRGLHADNPVNRPLHGGVQLELPPRIRGMGPYWLGWPKDSPNPHTEALVATLADAALSWPATATATPADAPEPNR